MKKKLKSQIKNQVTWWDYTSMLDLMEIWLRNASHQHKVKGHFVRSDRTAKELLIAAELVKRIKNDEIYDKPNNVLSSRNSYVKEDALGLGLEAFSYGKDGDKKRQADLDYLMDFMKKRMFGWWD